ncbi:ABC transporter substrate-binding protein [Microbacteriaceae bacterium VKM Ac-2855]|nr:ABC transporter substrate-binding protein [Microbacteriaceae bacterium VKM Ac-2855]
MRPRTFTPRLLGATALIAVSALALSACSSGSSDESSAPAEGAATVSTMFGDIEVPAASDDLKVVALGWSDAEMALALGVVPIAVEDWQGFGEENKGVGPWATGDFGDVTPTLIARADSGLNFEEIQALSPDLILNTRSSNDEEEFDRLNEIAPTVYAPADTGAFATSWDVQLQQVADALGKSDEGTALVESTKADIAAAADEHPEFAGLTAVAATKFGDAYGAYLAGDGRFDILSDLGFVQNPAVDALESSGFYAAVSAENVSAFDADVAVVLPIGFTAAEIEADPLLASLNVTKDGRAIVLDADDELSGAYSAASVLSIQVVLADLVPKLAEAAAKVAS